MSTETASTATPKKALEITVPALIPGTHNLDSYLDKRLVVWLRDGRKLFGILRAFDQFQNIVLQDTYERFYVELEYAEEYRGVFLDDEEWQSINRRMSKFRRPVDQIMGRWRHERKELLQTRLANDDPELAENDAY